MKAKAQCENWTRLWGCHAHMWPLNIPPPTPHPPAYIHVTWHKTAHMISHPLSGFISQQWPTVRHIHAPISFIPHMDTQTYMYRHAYTAMCIANGPSLHTHLTSLAMLLRLSFITVGSWPPPNAHWSQPLCLQNAPTPTPQPPPTAVNGSSNHHESGVLDSNVWGWGVIC